MYERLLKLMKVYMPNVDLEAAGKNARLMADLGMDSIAMLMLSVAMEDEFGLTFTEPVVFNTVQDVLDFLDKNATKR
jgi:acyl carrier protein